MGITKNKPDKTYKRFQSQVKFKAMYKSTVVPNLNAIAEIVSGIYYKLKSNQV